MFPLSSLAILVLAAVPCFAGPAGRAIIYPSPENTVPAADFRVSVEGRNVFVYDTEVAAFASFALSGPVEVKITPQRDVRTVDIRPLSKGIRAEVRKNTVTLRLSEPCQLSVEINGDTARPLLLFANPPEPQEPPKDAANIRYFEPGRVHEAGAITVESGGTVFIPGGAIVHGTIEAKGARDIRIAGHGILDGSRIARKMGFLDLRECAGVKLSGLTVVNSPGWTVHLRNCDNVEVENLKLIGWRANSDGLDINGSQHVRVRRSFLYDADDCVAVKAIERPVKDVRVSDTVFWNIKAGNAMEIGFELRAALVSDVEFSDCDLIHVERGAAMSVHVGGAALVSDVVYRNIRVEDAGELIDLFVGLSIYSEDCPPQWHRRNWGTPLQAVLLPERQEQPGTDNAGQWVKPEPGERAGYAAKRGNIRNIRFENISATGKRFPVSIVGGFDREHTVEGVTVDGLFIQGRKIGNATEGKFTVREAAPVVFGER